jgi:hypothetical protein
MSVASRKQRPISHGSLKLLRANILLNGFFSIASSTLKSRLGSSCESNRWEIDSRSEVHGNVGLTTHGVEATSVSSAVAIGIQNISRSFCIIIRGIWGKKFTVICNIESARRTSFEARLLAGVRNRTLS